MFGWDQLRFIFSGAGLFVKVASSNGRHLKAFLYPPHATLRLQHCAHVGFSSPHFKRLDLHVIQPSAAAR